MLKTTSWLAAAVEPLNSEAEVGVELLCLKMVQHPSHLLRATAATQLHYDRCWR